MDGSSCVRTLTFLLYGATHVQQQLCSSFGSHRHVATIRLIQPSQSYQDAICHLPRTPYRTPSHPLLAAAVHWLCDRKYRVSVPQQQSFLISVGNVRKALSTLLRLFGRSTSCSHIRMCVGYVLLLITVTSTCYCVTEDIYDYQHCSKSLPSFSVGAVWRAQSQLLALSLASIFQYNAPSRTSAYLFCCLLCVLTALCCTVLCLRYSGSIYLMMLGDNMLVYTRTSCVPKKVPQKNNNGRRFLSLVKQNRP